MNTCGPMIGSAPSGGFGRPKWTPAFFATKNQNNTAAKLHNAADQKNNRGLGKNDLNIGLVFLGLALDSRQLSLYG